ncbi:MAG: dienelactone hydrolase family protein, partial [Chloroflexi bacterium]|nr:dienelactone hydrolase family protein [Chloroflexota bacterium]
MHKPGVVVNTGGSALRQSAVAFNVEGLRFEGVVAQPEEHNGSMPGVVICHPHPLYGGNMDNNVVLSLSFALAKEGFVTLRFNFRGVGNSEGEHTKGELEKQEVLGALKLLKAWPGVDSRRIGLAGYSFGTSVILGHSELYGETDAIALVSPPFRAIEGTPLKESKVPVLIVTGDRDRLVDSTQLDTELASFTNAPEFKL